MSGLQKSWRGVAAESTYEMAECHFKVFMANLIYIYYIYNNIYIYIYIYIYMCVCAFKEQ